MNEDQVFKKLMEIADALEYQVVERRLRKKELIEQIKARDSQPLFDDDLEAHYFLTTKECYRDDIGGFCHFESRMIYLNQFQGEGHHTKVEVLAHELGHAIQKEMGQHQENDFIDETIAEVIGQFLLKICMDDNSGFVVRLPAMELVGNFLRSKLDWPTQKLEMLKAEIAEYEQAK